MALFGSHKNDEPVPAHQQPVQHTARHSTSPSSSPRRSFFSRRRSSSDVSDTTSPHAHHTTGHNPNTLSKRSSGSIFHRNHHSRLNEDPSIVAARERVLAAEQAEKDADSALVRARMSVREAREEVRKLELEAKEEARLAKLKQDAAKGIGKRSGGLGRHG